MEKEEYGSFNETRVRTFRWLFWFSLVQLLACFAFPLVFFGSAGIRTVAMIELLNALTVGLLFGLYFMAVNIYGLFADKNRRSLYSAIIIIIFLWTVWAVVSWGYIEHMRYLT